MKTAYDVILRPVITEQSMESSDEKKYVFMVDTEANKVEPKVERGIFHRVACFLGF